MFQRLFTVLLLLTLHTTMFTATTHVDVTTQTEELHATKGVVFSCTTDHLLTTHNPNSPSVCKPLSTDDQTAKLMLENKKLRLFIQKQQQQIAQLSERLALQGEL